MRGRELCMILCRKLLADLTRGQGCYAGEHESDALDAAGWTICHSSAVQPPADTRAERHGVR